MKTTDFLKRCNNYRRIIADMARPLGNDLEQRDLEQLIIHLLEAHNDRFGDDHHEFVAKIADNEDLTVTPNGRHTIVLDLYELEYNSFKIMNAVYEQVNSLHMRHIYNWVTQTLFDTWDVNADNEQ